MANFTRPLQVAIKERHEVSEIDKELLEWVISCDDQSEVYAKRYGVFSLSRMDVEIFLSEEEISKYRIAEQYLLDNKGLLAPEYITQDYYSYIQAHNHEFFHYYQALTVPAFQIYQRLARGKVEYEAATMLAFLEEGNNYILGENNSIFEALKHPSFHFSASVAENFNELHGKYKFYRECWSLQYEGVSLLQIVEGMAHIFSMQVTDEAKNYLPDLEGNEEYYAAFNVFNSYIDDDFGNLNIRFKYLIFIYICYFSCQTFDSLEDKILAKPSRLFHSLCSRLNYYLTTYNKLLDRYARYSEDELRQLNQFKIDDECLELANKEQLANIYAFFELIPCLQADAEKHYEHATSSLKLSRELTEIFESLDVDLGNIFQLAIFSIFPFKWADLFEAYTKVQQSSFDGNEFETSDEIAFYEFVENCKKILNESVDEIHCCEEHGTTDKIDALKCLNEGGLGYYLERMTERSPSELFMIQEVI